MKFLINGDQIMKLLILSLILLFCLDISAQDSIKSITKPLKSVGTVKPASVSLNYNQLYLFEGDKPKLIPRILPGEAFNKKVIWQTSNPDVATVDIEGNVTIKGKGISVITVITEEGRHKAECKIEVDEKNLYGNTSGNINEVGYLAVQGSWIYYGNPSDGRKLYKMRIDGSEKTKLCDDRVSYINVSGHLIMYKNNSDGGKIYAININGEKRKCINDLDSNITNLSLYGTWLYYINTQDDNRIYSISVGGDHRHLVYEDKGIKKFTLAGDFIYIGSERMGLYKAKKRAGAELDALRWYSENPIWDLNTIYTMYGDGRLVKGDSPNHIEISVTKFNVSNNWIYYLTNDEHKNLRKIHTSGSMDQILSQLDNINKIYIAGEWIYFYRDSDPYDQIYKIRNDGLHFSRVE